MPGEFYIRGDVKIKRNKRDLQDDEYHIQEHCITGCRLTYYPFTHGHYIPLMKTVCQHFCCCRLMSHEQLGQILLPFIMLFNKFLVTHSQESLFCFNTSSNIGNRCLSFGSFEVLFNSINILSERTLIEKLLKLISIECFKRYW